MPIGKTATRIICRFALMAALALAALLAGGPAFAAEFLDRAELTRSLVPVTGDETRSLDLTVPFARGSAKLTEAARAQLAELAAALSGEKLREYRVAVYGHTDATGPAEYNLKLSRARAAEAVRFLVERGGLDPGRLRHEGYGEERLLTGLDPASPLHRRVEVVVTGDGPALSGRAGARTEKGDDAGRGDASDDGKKREEGGLRAVR